MSDACLNFHTDMAAVRLLLGNSDKTHVPHREEYNAIITAKQIQIHMTILETYYDLWKFKLNAQKITVLARSNT